MRIDFQRSERLSSGADQAWALVRDVIEVARCLPNVERIEAVSDGRYRAVVADAVGPFRVRLEVDLNVVASDAERRLEVTLKGEDRRTKTRVSGTLAAAVSGAADEATLSITAQAEILGTLASLGAGPIRRRTDEIFASVLPCLVARSAERPMTP